MNIVQSSVLSPVQKALCEPPPELRSLVSDIPEKTKWPEIHEANNVSMQWHVIKVEKYDSTYPFKARGTKQNLCLEILLPPRSSSSSSSAESDSDVHEDNDEKATASSTLAPKNSILWMPWTDDQTLPERRKGEYRAFRGGVMPRRQRVYGKGYAFSGQNQDPEAMPPDVMALCQEVKNIFHLAEPPTSALVNDYNNGREGISRHADDEESIVAGSSIYCWVMGPACRRMNFYFTKGEKILSIDIPMGLYVMRGPRFQMDYEHELPKTSEAGFKKLLQRAETEKWWGEHPLFEEETNASKQLLDKASWLSQQGEKVLGFLGGNEVDTFRSWCDSEGVDEHLHQQEEDSTEMQHIIQRADKENWWKEDPPKNAEDRLQWLKNHVSEVLSHLGAKQVEAYKQWRKWRTSFTLRHMVVEKKKEVDKRKRRRND